MLNDLTTVIVGVINLTCSNHLLFGLEGMDPPKDRRAGHSQVEEYSLLGTTGKWPGFWFSPWLSHFSELWFLDLKLAWSEDQKKKKWHICSKSCFNLWLNATFPFHTENWQTWVFHWLSSLVTPTADFSHPPPQALHNESSVSNWSQEKEEEKYLDNWDFFFSCSTKKPSSQTTVAMEAFFSVLFWKGRPTYY